jgi:transposase
VIIGDGAGFHHKQGHDNEGLIPSNVRILTLPPYSPELNPIEKLWDVVKDTICSINWESLDQLEDKMTATLKVIWEKSEGFSSFFTSSYLRTELNATNKLRKSDLFY